LKKTELTIPAEINSIIAIRNLIEKIGFRYAFTSNTIHATKLAVEEAVTNIIRHGYLNTTDKKITIQIQARLYSLGIVVIDQGSSFDPKQVNNPDIVKYIDIRKKGGLGIFMIRKLMDEFNYQVTDRGNEIHLLKYRDGCHRSNLRNFVHLLKTPSKLKIFLPMYLDCTRNMQ
jgi:anti-sigma regulatory factor (Ser/Thr protein kinase)